MAKDQAAKEHKEHKKEKKEKKRSETDGVKKQKKEKKDKKGINEAATGELTTKLLEHIDNDSQPAAPAPAPAPAPATAEDAEVEMDTSEAAPLRPAGALVPFANPLVEDKAAKKVLKSVKKASANRSLKRGVKEVVKALRKSPPVSSAGANTLDHGIVILAGDISPVDVISHIPVLCEDHGIPYVFVTSRAELGGAGATKRPTSVVMVVPNPIGKKKPEGDNQENFAKVYEELGAVVTKESKKVKI